MKNSGYVKKNNWLLLKQEESCTMRHNGRRDKHVIHDDKEKEEGKHVFIYLVDMYLDKRDDY